MPDFASLSDLSVAWVLAANTLVHEIGVPVPLMPTVLLAGAQIQERQGNAVVLILVITAATLIANAVWFAAGRAYGGRVLKTLCKVSLSPDACVGRTESAFSKWGRWSLVFGHFLPGASLVAPPLAGALGMRWPVFLGLTAAGAALYGGVIIGAGMLFSGGILALAKAVLERGTESLGIVLGVCAGYAAYKWWRRRAAAGALEAPRMSVAELKEVMGGNPPPVIVDVRGNAIQQADRRHIPGALFTTVGEVVQSVAEHPKSVQIVLYCACPNDASAAQGARALADAGYTRAWALRGGLDAWCSEVEGHSG